MRYPTRKLELVSDILRPIEGRVSTRPVWGKKGENEQCDLVRAERLSMIRLMVVMLIDIYLRIDKADVIFLKLFTNFPYSQITTR